MKKLSKGAVIGIAAGAAAFILMVVLIIAEELSGGRLIINNNTGRNIESLSIEFYDEVQEMTVDWLYEGSVAAGENIDLKYEGEYNFSGMSCICFVYVTFEGYDEIMVYDGLFEGPFGGNYELNFSEDGEQYFLHLRAYEGLFKSTNASNLDETYELYLDDADWDYID